MAHAGGVRLKPRDIALFAVGGFLLYSALSTKGYNPLRKVADDTEARISVAESTGKITATTATQLRDEFRSIDSPRAGVDFINRASQAGVFISPYEKPRYVKVEGRREGESMRVTAERQRAELAEITRQEAQKVGVMKQSDAYYKAVEAKREELASTPKDSNKKLDFKDVNKITNIVKNAMTWLSAHPRPAGVREGIDWERTVRNKRQAVTREINTISSAIRRKLADQKQTLGFEQYGAMVKQVLEAEESAKAQIRTLLPY